ncbi:MAG: hypothetical protein JKX87_06205 [Cycloclasticus sp.]|nr:hypothetical protein [Cycloclasticus sp.]
MAELRPSVLYILLVIGGILAGAGLIKGVFYDSEKFEGNRYEDSYAQFRHATLTEKQKTAITLLKKEGIEWAHFRFIEAIKDNKPVKVQAFIDAGMPLNSDSILLEIALSSSINKVAMLALLVNHYDLDLGALYTLPKFVNQFDGQITEVSKPYTQHKKETYRQAMLAYKVAYEAWEQTLDAKKKEMLIACDNDACRGGRINDARLMLADSEPKEPKQDYITKDRVYISLLTVFAWQKDTELIEFMQQQVVTPIPNKLFLTDSKLIYFTVNARGESRVVSP